MGAGARHGGSVTFEAVADWLQVTAIGWFTLTTVVRSVSLHRRLRRNPILLGPRHDGLGGILALTEFITTNAWILLLLASVLPIKPGALKPLLEWRWQPNAWFIATGLTLIALALALRQAAMRALGDSWRLGLDRVRPGPLVTSGPYAWSRNPIYLFFALWMLGTFISTGLWALGIVGTLSMMQLHALALQEEQALLTRFGQDYWRYRETVRRYCGRWRQPAQETESTSWPCSSTSR